MVLVWRHTRTTQMVASIFTRMPVAMRAGEMSCYLMGRVRHTNTMKQHLQLLPPMTPGLSRSCTRHYDRSTIPAHRADLELFFRSIHGTLNHLLVANRVGLGRAARHAGSGQRIRR